MILPLLLALLAAAPASPTQHERYQRSVSPSRPGASCAVIDAAVYPHAAPFLKDLRLYTAAEGSGKPEDLGLQELPYVLTLSESQQLDPDPARILNLGTHGSEISGARGSQISFDLAMPARPYTEVVLDIDAQNFLATATVTGTSAPGAPGGTRLGEFTLFDLTAQHLSRSTTIALQESSFPYLHIALSVSPAPGSRSPALTPASIRAATVPPSREAQTLYTRAAESTSINQLGRQTVATFRLAQRIPVERVSVVLPDGYSGNFSRDLRIADHPAGTPAASGETISGTIQRVHLTVAGHEIRQEQLSVPAALGANLQGDAVVEVAIDNGDDRPLPIHSVVLEMRERRLCFNVPSPEPVTLFYGDPALEAPQYDLARIFVAGAPSSRARLGPEQRNPAWTPREDLRSFTARHPHLLWIALLIVVCILALVAFRSSARPLR